MAPSSTLSGDSSVGTWLDHPVGGLILRDLLAQAGQTADTLRPVRRLAIKRLVKLSKGSFPAELIDELVRRVEIGDVPASAATATTDAAAPAPVDENAVDAVERPEWVERISDGRFTGKTVIVTGAGSGIGRATASRVARE